MLVSPGRTAIAVSFSMSAIGWAVRAIAARASTPGRTSVVVVAATVVGDPATVVEPAAGLAPDPLGAVTSAVVVGAAPASVVVGPSAASRSGLDEPGPQPASATTPAASTPTPRHAV